MVKNTSKLHKSGVKKNQKGHSFLFKFKNDSNSEDPLLYWEPQLAVMSAFLILIFLLVPSLFFGLSINAIVMKNYFSFFAKSNFKISHIEKNFATNFGEFCVS